MPKIAQGSILRSDLAEAQFLNQRQNQQLEEILRAGWILEDYLISQRYIEAGYRSQILRLDIKLSAPNLMPDNFGIPNWLKAIMQHDARSYHLCVELAVNEFELGASQMDMLHFIKDRLEAEAIAKAHSMVYPKPTKLIQCDLIDI